MIKRPARAILLALSAVTILATIAYAETFYALTEYPYIITGYSSLVVDGTEATAYSQTQTDYNEPYDELRAHCQLWEDGHILDFQTNIRSTIGFDVIYSSGDYPWSDPLVEESLYDSNFWVYGVHRGELYSMENDIQSDGYVSTSKRGGDSLKTWNDVSMTIAKSNSGDGAVLVPWYKLDTLKSVLGKDLGGEFMITVIDGVLPLLERGDLLPTVSIDKEVGIAMVFVPKEKGGHFVVKFELPKAETTPVSTASM